MVPQLLAIGLIALLGQVALLRELNVALYGSELVYLVALGIWLLGTAAGALWPGSRRAAPAAPSARRGAASPARGGAASPASTVVPASAAAPADPTSHARIRILFLWVALLLPAAVVWTRACRILLGGVRGAYLPFGMQLLALLVALLPVSFALGLLFQRVARRAAAGGVPLARAYGVECLGALAGGVLGTAALRAGALNLVLVLACALLALALGFPPPGPRRAAAMARGSAGGAAIGAGGARAAAGRWDRRRLGIIGAGVLLALAVGISPLLDRWLTGWTHPGLLATRDTPYGRVTITGREGQIAVFHNGALAYESQGTAAEEFVHLAALQHPQPRRVLVFGGAAAGLLAPLLAHGPVLVDDVELDAAAQALLSRHLPDDATAALASPRVQVWRTDPRRFLRGLAGRRGENYDLILIGMPEPASGQANRFFTREFFAACARKLDAGGVLALQLPGAENLWLPQLVRRTASIERALRDVLPHTLVLPGATTVVIASPQAVSRDPERAATRLRDRAIVSGLVTPAYLRHRYTDDRLGQVAALLAAARVPANTDARPVCYQYTLRHWLARLHPAFRSHDPAGGTGGGAWPAVALAAGLLGAGGWFVRQRPSWRLAALAAAAGGATMAIESVLLLAYQARAGLLYLDLGLLLMMMMGGLAAGAWLVARWADERPDLFDQEGSWRERWPLPSLVIGLVLLSVLLGIRLWLLPPPGLPETAIWLLAGGMAASGVFAGAASLAPSQEGAVAPLYAADVAGGCAGVLAASFWLIPLAGLPGTALLVGLLGLLALIVV